MHQRQIDNNTQKNRQKSACGKTCDDARMTQYCVKLNKYGYLDNTTTAIIINTSTKML